MASEFTAAKALSEAVQQTKLAYAFCPGSYTAGALNACLAAAETHQQPDWIGAFLEHQGIEQQLNPSTSPDGHRP